ncbi:phage tail assembly chaperone [Rhizobium sp. KAs_5_22]|uniref:rcc01693 family protein n=1 Tax=Ciceribacter selenitireducens TaxID=448181 RepID=UPI0004B46763|nr:rcc01693 family protein [Ciceribacter selenitireducens]PPJ47241.1 phage tail assembly chaperone [Rhizobium sp. KAs_5_22]
MRAAGGEAAARAFPWEAVLDAGLCRLRLPPHVFWGLSLVEFAAMAGAFAPRPVRFSRAGLEGLMRAFPDGEGGGSPPSVTA